MHNRLPRMLLPALSFATLAGPAHAGVLGVPGQFPTIQQAIDAASDGDTILVQPGIYTESIDLLGKAITLRGFNPGIEGEFMSTVITGNFLDPAITCASGEGAGTVLESLIVRASFNKPPTAVGGILNDGASPTITGCTFNYCNGPVAGAILNTNGAAPSIAGTLFFDNSGNEGGAIHNNNASPTITDCEFIANSADRGGGVYSAGAGTTRITSSVYLGNSVRSSVNNGGGAFAGGPGTSAIITGCLFEENFAFNSATGGAIRIDDALSAQISGCHFEGNIGRMGGAIRTADAGSVTVELCTFTDNIANNNGGAISSEAGTLSATGCGFSGAVATADGGVLSLTGGAVGVFRNCSFEDNSSTRDGGAVFADNASCTFTNCLFSNNVSFGIGSVGRLISSTLRLEACTVARNFGVGHAVVAVGGAAPRLEVVSSVVWANGFVPTLINVVPRATVENSLIQGGFAGAGNIDADPLFVNESGAGGTEQDFRLRAGSPAIDAGDNDAIPVGITTDLDGNPRFTDDPATPDTGIGDAPVVDLGCFEFQPATATCPGDCDGNATVNFNDLVAMLFAFGPGLGPCDTDGSETVDFNDLVEALFLFGPCP